MNKPFLNHIGGLQEENARIQDEIERLTEARNLK